MDLEFTNKKILLAGIGGIGYAVAELLGRLGSELYILDIDTEKMTTAQQSLSFIKYCGKCNFSDVNSIEGTIKDVLAVSGPIDGFVFCSGITSSRPFKMAKYEAMLNVMNINFFSFVEIVRCITKKGCYADNLSIVGLSSVGAILGNPSQTAYCASKAAMNGAVRSIAKELAPKSIRINTIAPGTTDTPMFREAEKNFGSDSSAFANRLERQYLGLCKPEDIANSVAFLLSNMSRMITGSCLGVDGGKLTS